MKSLVALTACLFFILPMSAKAEKNAANAEKPQVYRHLVLFKFKDDAKAENVQKVIDAFAKLPSQIETITGFEWGTNVSPENKAQGFTHCFSVTFADKAGLETYLPHPAHKAFGQLLGPVLDQVLVFDFVPEK